MLIVRVPLRISLGGGGTDLFNWYSKHGSFLITATINKFIYITLSQRSLDKDFWLSYSVIENLKNVKKIKHSIIKKIFLKYPKLNNLEVHTISEVPANSGLGSSGSLSVGLIQALNSLSKKKVSSKVLSEKSVDIEMSLNKRNAGKQDQYAAAYGGLIKLKKDKEIKKVVMCSGKIYYDLIEARENIKNNEVVFIRIEQLYPFPAKTLANLLKKYEKAEFIWCQEEPKNMGAWNTVRNYIDRTLEIIYFTKDKVKYVGRKASASTATGNLNKHLAQQKEILEKVVGKIN